MATTITNPIDTYSAAVERLHELELEAAAVRTTRNSSLRALVEAAGGPTPGGDVPVAVAKTLADRCGISRRAARGHWKNASVAV